MPRHYHSLGAKCPYYRGESCGAQTGGAAVFCAGIGEAETVRLFFRTKESKTAFVKRLCRSDWEVCALAKIQEGGSE